MWPKWPGQSSTFSAAGLAAETGLDDAQVGVHQTHVDREAVVVVRIGVDDFRRGHPTDLVGAQEGELDRLDSLRDPPAWKASSHVLQLQSHDDAQGQELVKQELERVRRLDG